MFEKTLIVSLIAGLLYVWYKFSRKLSAKNLEINKLKQKSNCVRQPVEALDKEVRKEEEHVRMHVDDWHEVRIYHPLFNQTYLYGIMNIFNDMEFVERVYIAANGLVRMDLKGREAGNYEQDIALNSSISGKIMMIRNYKSGYEEMENEVIEKIVKHTEAIKESVSQ